MKEQTSTTETVPKQKSSKRGCLIAAVVVVVLIILVVAVGGYLTYRFTQTEKGQAIIGFTRAVAEGAKAPGTAELREMGCDQAFVVEMEKFAALGNIPGGDMLEGVKLSGMAVVCQASSTETAPSCETVAQTYIKSFGDSAPYPFASVVIKGVGEGLECIHYYASDGTPKQ